MTTLEEKMRHNDNIINNAITALVAFRMVEPVMLVNPNYATRVVTAFLEANRFVCRAFNLPEEKLYIINQEDDED